MASCKPAEERTRNLIPENVMVQVLAETHIFEAVAEGRKMQSDSLARFIKINYAEIFRKNGVMEEQFFRTFDYYERNPGKMDELMTKVIDELSKMEAEIKSSKEAQEAADSIGK